jgi:hypothetical protein
MTHRDTQHELFGTTQLLLVQEATVIRVKLVKDVVAHRLCFIIFAIIACDFLVQPWPVMPRQEMGHDSAAFH